MGYSNEHGDMRPLYGSLCILQTGLTEPAIPEEAAPQVAACVVVNTDTHCLIRRRRRLYEAVLQLEADKVAVVDRRLPCSADLALSAESCFCAWAEDALKVTGCPIN